MAEPGGVAEALLDRCRLPEGSVLVALSGGADSAVAAWVAQRLATGWVRAAFVHHGLASSDLMADAAGAVATHLGLPLETVEVSVAAGASPEAQARDVRLEALETLGEGDWIVTGHTADDRVETMLLNLFRGAGATGIGSIKERRDRYVRPLLAFRRHEIRRAATDLGIPYVDDPANLDRAHARNRIRHDLIPQLEAEWNPRLVESLLRTADAVAADDEWLEAMAAQLLSPEATDRMPAALLATAPDAIAARVVRRLLRTDRHHAPPSARDVAAVRAVAAGQAIRLPLEHDWEVSREGPFVVVAPKGERSVGSDVPLAVPDDVEFGEWRIDSRRVTGRPPVLIGGRRALIDGSISELVVRGAREGDRIDMQRGRKRVMEALAEAGVAPHLRHGWPVVAADGRIVWLAGVRVAAWATAVGADQILLSSRRERM